MHCQGKKQATPSFRFYKVKIQFAKWSFYTYVAEHEYIVMMTHYLFAKKKFATPAQPNTLF